MANGRPLIAVHRRIARVLGSSGIALPWGLWEQCIGGADRQKR